MYFVVHYSYLNYEHSVTHSPLIVHAYLTFHVVVELAIISLTDRLCMHASGMQVTTM